MMKFGTAFFACVLLLASVAAQNSSQSAQELPSAPEAVQPRFPGASPAPAAPELAKPVPSHTPTPAPAPAVTTPAPAQDSTAQQAPKAAAPDSATQAPPQAAPLSDLESGEFRIGVQVDLVNLIFTAVDKRGHFIRDLKQEELRLLDEGKPPVRIQAFESESGLPLRVGLLIDASNSIRERFHFEQEAAIEFLNQVVRPKSDLAFVIGFDSVAELTQDFTDNGNALGRGIRILRPGGGTALHDAVFTACEKLGKARAGGSARRAIILLSDGDDNQSRHTREEAIEAALRAEVIIYVIDTAVTESNSKGEKVLNRYADATGGRIFFPMRIQEVTTAFKEIQDELRSQYVLAYKPENFLQNGSYRSIVLDVPKRPNVKIRVRKGYYAPKG
jgi:VWFA-related protein